MNGENVPLIPSNGDNSFYTGKEGSTGEVGTSGLSRFIQYGLPIISMLVASGCTIYGTIQAKSILLALPFIIILFWLVIHFLLLYFIRNEKHEFHPPGWFIFVSSCHICTQSIIVAILTVAKAEVKR